MIPFNMVSNNCTEQTRQHEGANSMDAGRWKLDYDHQFNVFITVAAALFHDAEGMYMLQNKQLQVHYRKYLKILLDF
jgi:hypothetical protein